MIKSRQMTTAGLICTENLSTKKKKNVPEVKHIFYTKGKTEFHPLKPQPSYIWSKNTADLPNARFTYDLDHRKNMLRSP